MTLEALDWAPEACTLPTVERPLRENEFADLFASSLVRVERVSPDTARLGLTRDSTARARDLAEQESSCCSFFTFEILEADAESVMSISVPAAQVRVLDAFVDSARRAAGLESPRS
ncbi:hypothetical protein [Agromyces sp. Soil535]|uniref:hypothetical protein n=1 Tax=Agromyces sp. Soil535 TaxID=1736390 RepID=UPI0006FF7840|nr:hypothetical protein [Agromyces sp. Soil535]KRE31071.1 hypothetical protein ASG80_00840 [Agromyces sp. Soil535]